MKAVIFAILCSIWSLSAGMRAQAEMTYVYARPGAAANNADYLDKLLATALDRTVAAYGPYSVRRIADLPRNRQVHDLETDNGEISFALLSPDEEVNTHLHPVLIPFDKGILGYRVLIIHRSLQPAFSKVRSLDDLKLFSLGQNFAWADVGVLRANGLTVWTGDDLDNLYLMLDRERFEAFPRGVSEVDPEFAPRRAAYTDLEIERTLLLYYPFPAYFWFARSAEGERMARRVEEGLRSMIRDGTFDVLLKKYIGPRLKGLGLSHRRLLVLRDASLPPETPLGDSQLWVTPEQLKSIAERR